MNNDKYVTSNNLYFLKLKTKTEMKKLNFILFAGVLFLFSSCVVRKTYTTEEKKMKIGNDVFVIKKNGEKISGTKFSEPSIWNGKADWIKIDEKKIDGNEIVAFQNKDAYFVKFEKSGDHFWIRQLKRGKINLYYYDVLNALPSQTNTNPQQHFVFQKGSEQLSESSISEIAKMLKDNQAAYTRFVSQFGSEDRVLFPKQLQMHPKVLMEAIDIYNGNKP